METTDQIKSLLAVVGTIALAQACDGGGRTRATMIPFEKGFTYDHAYHLLSRCTFGVSKGQIEQCLELGLEETLELLFKDRPLPLPPINFDCPQDPFVPLGETWIDAGYDKSMLLEPSRHKSIRCWIMGVIYNEDISIREQLVLFWHNHFGVSDIIEAKYEYVHNDLLRKRAWGNFKQLTKEITIDPAMLRFLSGTDNTKESPNENYARELLELFTLGKGDLVGPGDYSTYTEDDVRKVSKILTGWKDHNWTSYYEQGPIKAKFHNYRHWEGDFTLSERLNNITIPDMKEESYSVLIDEIFKNRHVALRISRKLYRWFVHYDITEKVEQEVVEPMANILIDGGFEIKPVLIALFKSNHFYEQIQQGPKIKNPIEYIFGTLKKIPFQIPEDPIKQYPLWNQFFHAASSMGLEYFKPPTVAGWKAYYQAPLYYRLWANSATLKNRKIFNEHILEDGYSDVEQFGLHIEELINRMSSIRSVSSISEYLVNGLLNKNAAQNHIEDIQSMMLQSNKEAEFLAMFDLADKDKKCSEFMELKNRFKRTIEYILNLPEYNLL